MFSYYARSRGERGRDVEGVSLVLQGVVRVHFVGSNKKGKREGEERKCIHVRVQGSVGLRWQCTLCDLSVSREKIKGTGRERAQPH